MHFVLAGLVLTWIASLARSGRRTAAHAMAAEQALGHVQRVEESVAFLIDAQRYTEALEQFRKTLELDTNYGPAYTRGGALFEALGRETEAVRAYLRADLLTGTAAHELAGLERAANIGGLRGYRKKHLDLLRQRANSGRVPYLDFATLYVQLADNNNALEMLGAAYQQHAPGLAWVRASAVWRPLRTDYRYQSLLRRMRFPSLR